MGTEFHLGSISHIFEKKEIPLNYVKRNLSVSEIRRIEMCAAQYLPGTASLIEEIDKKLMVLLRDGRTLIGYLRSVDQFANLVLHRTIERIHVGSEYGDIPRGIFIVRGENVVSMFIINAQGRKLYTYYLCLVRDQIIMVGSK